MDSLLVDLGDLATTISNNPLALLAIGALLFPLIQWGGKKLYKAGGELVTGLSKKKQFLKHYLTWIVNANKFVSVLPSTLAAVKGGTLHLIELDEIYINLTVSRGDEIAKSYGCIPNGLTDRVERQRCCGYCGG